MVDTDPNQHKLIPTLPRPPPPAPQFSSNTPQATNYILVEQGKPISTVLSTIELNCSFGQGLAYSFEFTAACRTTGRDVERVVLERVNSHHQILYLCYSGTTHGGVLEFQPREFVCREVFKVFTDEATGIKTAISVYSSCEHPTRSSRSDRVRATTYVVRKFRQLPDGRCQLTYLDSTEAGGSVPAWIINYYAKRNLFTTRISRYFHNLRSQADEQADEQASATRLEFEDSLSSPSAYVQEEDDMVDTGVREIDEFLDNPNKKKVSSS